MVAVDVVTATGQKLHCSETQNSELLWAARGAGPGFPAIVTRFYLQTRPAYSHMRSSFYTYARKDFKQALNWILNVSQDILTQPIEAARTSDLLTVLSSDFRIFRPRYRNCSRRKLSARVRRVVHHNTLGDLQKQRGGSACRSAAG